MGIEKRNFEGVIDGQLEVDLEYCNDKIAEFTERKEEIKREQERRFAEKEKKKNNAWSELLFRKETTV